MRSPLRLLANSAAGLLPAIEESSGSWDAAFFNVRMASFSELRHLSKAVDTSGTAPLAADFGAPLALALASMAPVIKMVYSGTNDFRSVSNNTGERSGTGGFWHSLRSLSLATLDHVRSTVSKKTSETRLFEDCLYTMTNFCVNSSRQS